MTDYTAHEIHRLDQAYPDAVNTLDDLTGNPDRKRRLAEVGPEVFAAELTRDLANSAANPMSLAAWAAVATTQHMTAAKTWEDDTDAAWAKVDELTADVERLRRERSDAATAYLEDVTDATAKVDELTAERDHANRQYAEEAATVGEAWAALNRAGFQSPTASIAALIAQMSAALTEARTLAATRSDEVGRLVDENARVRQQRDEALAEREKARTQVCLIVTCLGCDEKYEYDGGVVHFATLDEAQSMAEDDDWRRVGDQFVCGSCVHNPHPFKSDGLDVLTCERCDLEEDDHEPVAEKAEATR
ncbi:hypothetical protein ACGF3C_02435 [Micromonospora sp. NPDC047762]|uniref:hypothetical protein n=1 Tax=Micromonospora sp. NPDC047762 TaxID=3364255 RepID=UPI00371C3F4A